MGRKLNQGTTLMDCIILKVDRREKTITQLGTRREVGKSVLRLNAQETDDMITYHHAHPKHIDYEIEKIKADL